MRTLLAVLISIVTLSAHDIITTNLTYSRDISRIFARRCAACHASASSIPLTTYEETRPWAVAIKEQVLSRSMPPWGAVKGFGNLLPDRALTQEEIMIVAAWVIGGAPAGDPATLPKTQPASVEPPSRMDDSLAIDTRKILAHSLQVAGLRPFTKVDSARIVARLPDGRTEPLVWLYHFDPQSNPNFRFRQQLSLPARTVIESSAPLRFSLLRDRVPAQ